MNDTRQLVQSMHSSCKDCNKAAYEYAKQNNAHNVAPIFDDMRVPNALSIGCKEHQKDHHGDQS